VQGEQSDAHHFFSPVSVPGAAAGVLSWLVALPAPTGVTPAAGAFAALVP
jgi:hypothetical protein